MSKIYLTERQINAAIYKAINEAFGVGMNGQFISNKSGWGPRFTSFAEDAKKFATPEDAQDYIDTNLGDDFGASVVSIPFVDDMDMDEMNMLRESIRGAVRQVINEIDMSQFGFNPGRGTSDMFEKAKVGSEKSKESKGEKADERALKGDMKKRASKRAIVLKWLKKNAVNNAEIMRLLWHPTPDKEDTKRGEFYKKRDGKINKDSGAQYSFNDAEINKLYAIKSNGV